MITKIHYGAFKSHVNSELPLEPLTILVGTNASGKTNAVEGLTLLSSITTGAEISHSIESVEGHIRGGSKFCAPFGSNSFSLGCDFESPLPELGEYCRYQIDIGNLENTPIVQREFCTFIKEDSTVRKPELFLAENPNVSLHTITAKIDNFIRGGIKPEFNFDARFPVLFQMMPRISTDSRIKSYSDAENVISTHNIIIKNLLSFLSSINVLNPKPDIIRKSGYIPLNTQKIDSSGRNLSAVLYNICKKEKEKNEILDFLKSVQEQKIKDIEYIKTPKYETRLIIKESYQGKEEEVPLELLSDGTIRLLVILAAAFSLSKGELMVLEEIDTSLHPNKVISFIEKLMDVVKQKEAKLLVTTHNPALLDAIQPKNYKSVVICYRENITGISKFVRLIDIPDIDSIIIRDTLGDVITKQLYDKFMRRSNVEREKERSQIMLNWKKRMGVL